MTSEPDHAVTGFTGPFDDRREYSLYFRSRRQACRVDDLAMRRRGREGSRLDSSRTGSASFAECSPRSGSGSADATGRTDLASNRARRGLFYLADASDRREPRAPGGRREFVGRATRVARLTPCSPMSNHAHLGRGKRCEA